MLASRIDNHKDNPLTLSLAQEALEKYRRLERDFPSSDYVKAQIALANYNLRGVDVILHFDDLLHD